MGKRALDFSRAHPDPSAGYTAAVQRLSDAIGSAEQVSARQRVGRFEVRAATELKESLRRTMKRGHLVHLTIAARMASREVPALNQRFVPIPEAMPYLAFRIAAVAALRVTAVRLPRPPYLNRCTPTITRPTTTRRSAASVFASTTIVAPGSLSGPSSTSRPSAQAIRVSRTCPSCRTA